MKDEILDDFEWFDGWCEHQYMLNEKGDFAGMVRSCLERLERSPNELRMELSHEGLLLFSTDELVQALRADPRFIVEGEHSHADNSVNRKLK